MACTGEMSDVPRNYLEEIMIENDVTRASILVTRRLKNRSFSEGERRNHLKEAGFKYRGEENGCSYYDYEKSTGFAMSRVAVAWICPDRENGANVAYKGL